MLDNKGGSMDQSQSYPTSNRQSNEEVIEIPEEPADDEIKVENIPF
jgi:hypothetical protein